MKKKGILKVLKEGDFMSLSLKERKALVREEATRYRSATFPVTLSLSQSLIILKNEMLKQVQHDKEWDPETILN